MYNIMRNLKEIKAFTIIELLIVTVILAILLLIVPNLDLFVQNAVKKEGVLLVRTIIEQERVYKADNGTFSMNCESVQNWKTVKTLLLDNKYFKPENIQNNNGKTTIIYQTATIDNPDNFGAVIVRISSNTSTNKKCNDTKCKLEIEVKASYKTKASGWHVMGHLIEGTGIKDKKGKDTANKIVFEEAKEIEGALTDWQEISL